MMLLKPIRSEGFTRKIGTWLFDAEFGECFVDFLFDLLASCFWRFFWLPNSAFDFPRYPNNKSDQEESGKEKCNPLPEGLSYDY